MGIIWSMSIQNTHRYALNIPILLKISSQTGRPRIHQVDFFSSIITLCHQKNINTYMIMHINKSTFFMYHLIIRKYPIANKNQNSISTLFSRSAQINFAYIRRKYFYSCYFSTTHIDQVSVASCSFNQVVQCVNKIFL